MAHRAQLRLQRRDRDFRVRVGLHRAGGLLRRARAQGRRGRRSESASSGLAALRRAHHAVRGVYGADLVGVAADRPPGLRGADEPDRARRRAAARDGCDSDAGLPAHQPRRSAALHRGARELRAAPAPRGARAVAGARRLRRGVSRRAALRLEPAGVSSGHRVVFRPVHVAAAFLSRGCVRRRWTRRRAAAPLRQGPGSARGRVPRVLGRGRAVVAGERARRYRPGAARPVPVSHRQDDARSAAARALPRARVPGPARRAAGRGVPEQPGGKGGAPLRGELAARVLPRHVPLVHQEAA